MNAQSMRKGTYICFSVCRCGVCGLIEERLERNKLYFIIIINALYVYWLAHYTTYYYVCVAENVYGRIEMRMKRPQK